MRIQLHICHGGLFTRETGSKPDSRVLVGRICSLNLISGVWGALAPILPGDVTVPGALVTGALLFVVVATLGFLLAG